MPRISTILLALSIWMIPCLALAESDDTPIIITPSEPNTDTSNMLDSSDVGSDDSIALQTTQTQRPVEEFFTTSPTKKTPASPAPPTNSNAQIVMRPQIYGPTTHKDHIWLLAEKLRPGESVTIQQTLLALQRANPKAFTDNNINGLKPGQMLRVPTLSQIQEINPEQALLLITEQNQKWKQPAPKKALAVKNKENENDINYLVMLAKQTKAEIDANAAKAAKMKTVNPDLLATNNTQNNLPQRQAQSSLDLAANTSSTKPAIPKTTAPTKPDPTESIVMLNKNSFEKPQQAPLLDLPVPMQTSSKKVASTMKVNAPSTNDAQQFVTVEQQLNNLKQNIVEYKTQTDAQIQQLKNEYLQAQTQINSLSQKIIALQNIKFPESKNIALLPAANANSNLNKSINPIALPSPTQGIAAYLPKTKTEWWILWAAVFLIVLLWIPSSRKRLRKLERQEPIVELEQTDPDLKDEYDFMSSAEAIPAKLDLGRAYIDMEDFDSAKQVLKEVIKYGNKIERKQAKLMLAKIK